MSIRGVLLDYSGTLFHLEPGAAWVHGLAGHDGAPLNEALQAELLAGLTSPVGPSAHLPADLTDAWERRDLDPEVHRMVYLAALRAAGLDLGPGVPEQLYDRILDPAAWRPYPDAGEVLRLLKAAGIPVAVVSNIPWDIRDVFERNGFGELVAEFVLSYAEGMVKPDPKIFRLACERIGVAPERVLMIGDSAHADGGATEVGCRFERVEPQATANRPDALLGAVRAHGLAG
ncbi:HAD family hydrolase [Actinokineospora sp.]|uniref:HAD family hydrolase n=1 Tax=Actinokineospora sp. TaxID=1872133 RepID=UPI004037A5C0